MPSTRASAQPCGRHPERLRVLLIERPGARRDGRKLQLEIDGYDVQTAWDDANDRVDEAMMAFVCAVAADAGEVVIVRLALARLTSSLPILWFTTLARQALETAGIGLRAQDFVVCATKPTDSSA